MATILTSVEKVNKFCGIEKNNYLLCSKFRNIRKKKKCLLT